MDPACAYPHLFTITKTCFITLLQTKNLYVCCLPQHQVQIENHQRTLCLRCGTQQRCPLGEGIAPQLRDPLSQYSLCVHCSQQHTRQDKIESEHFQHKMQEITAVSVEFLPPMSVNVIYSTINVFHNFNGARLGTVLVIERPCFW